MSIDLQETKMKAHELIDKYALTIPVHVFELADLLSIVWKTSTPLIMKRTIIKNEPSAKIAIKKWENVLGYYDRTKNVILLNENNHPITRMRFTLAHEIGHQILHHQIDSQLRSIFLRHDVVSPRNDMETEANYFASYLLVPDNSLKDRIKISKLYFTDDDIIKALAEVFAVSPDMMRIRLKTFKKDFKDLWNEHSLDKKFL